MLKSKNLRWWSKNASVLLLCCSQMCKKLRLFEGVKCWSMLGIKSLLEQGACF